MGIFAWLFSPMTRAFKEQKKRLIEESRLWALENGKNLDAEIKSIATPFIPHMRGEGIASAVDQIPTHSQEIAERLLAYPPQVGAHMALGYFGAFLVRSKLGQAPRANLMLAFESMFALNPHRVEQTAELLACSLCMMDSRRTACDTYTSMVDYRMKSLVRGELLVLSRQAWEQFLDEEAERTRTLVERLLQVIADKSLLWKYRQDAVETLGRLGDSRAVEPIIALIGDKSMYSTVIIDALKNLGDRRAVEPLLAFLSEGNEYERGHAAEALGEIGESRALTPLVEALRRHKEYFTRRKVIWALGKLGDSRAIRPLDDTLRGILSDDSIRERDKSQLEAEIKRALQKINDRGSSGTVGSGR